MMSFRDLLFGALLVGLGIVSLRADEILSSLKGTCAITVSTKANRFDLRLEHGACVDHNDCGENNTSEPLDAFAGFSIEDLRREGAHVDAVLTAEAGRLTCSGNIHDSKLTGEFLFEPNRAFVERMKQLGITGLDSQKLEAYTLFHIEASWLQALQAPRTYQTDEWQHIDRLLRESREYDSHRPSPRSRSVSSAARNVRR